MVRQCWELDFRAFELVQEAIAHAADELKPATVGIKRAAANAALDRCAGILRPTALSRV